MASFSGLLSTRCERPLIRGTVALRLAASGAGQLGVCQIRRRRRRKSRRKGKMRTSLTSIGTRAPSPWLPPRRPLLCFYHSIAFGQPRVFPPSSFLLRRSRNRFSGTIRECSGISLRREEMILRRSVEADSRSVMSRMHGERGSGTIGRGRSERREESIPST